jgi:hypothetical protein
MSFWKIDLTTEDGAVSAATTGGAACFVAAGLTVLGGILFAGAAPNTEEQIGVLVAAGLSLIVFLVAGWRLRSGKGAFWGGAAAALLVLEIITKLITLNGVGGLIINTILLIVITNGVRGAWALRSGFDEDAAEVFE